MNDQEIRGYRMFVRVQDFGVTNAAAFPASSLGEAKFAALNRIIEELDEHGAKETSGKSAAKTGTANKASARESLRSQMEAISRTARQIAANTPGMESSFRMPRTNGDQALLNSARAFLADATPLKAKFIEWEMPATFLEDLSATIDSFEQSINSTNQNKSKSVAASAAINEAIAKGKKIVRDLDPLVRNKFRNDPATLAAWESASHTERQPRRKKTPETTQTQAKHTA